MNTKLLPLLLLLAMPATAQTVSQSDAMAKAKAFLSQRSKKANGNRVAANEQLTLAYEATSTDGDACYYAFNRASGGFVIAGADACAQTILGYTDQGTFDIDRLPENVRWWLSTYQRQISSTIRLARQKGKTTAALAPKRTLTSTARASVAQLMQTRWAQEAPFNLGIIGGDNAYFAGCVAVAGAQVMKYWQYPAKGNDEEFAAETIGTGSTALTARATNTGDAIDWTNMANYYDRSTSTDYSVAANKAVADLVYNVGRASDMSYSTGGSGTTARALGAALIKNFGYDAAITVENRVNYTDEAWETKVYNELRAGRPIIYSGVSDKEGGHCFVCDGYDATNDTYHFNWGWRGAFDGYFALTGTYALNYYPEGNAHYQDVGYNFDKDQSILCGVKPNEGGKLHYDLMISKMSVSPYPSSGTYIVGNYLALQATLVNNTLSQTQELPLYVVLTNKKTGEKVYISTTTTISGGLTGSLIPTSFVTIPGNCVPGETYTTGFAYKDENGVWTEPTITDGSDLPEFTMAAATASLYLEGAPRFKDNAEAATLEDFEVTLPIHNGTNEDITKNGIDVSIYTKSGNYVTAATLGSITFPANSTTEVTVEGDQFLKLSDKLTEGSVYTFNITDDSYKTIYKARSSYFTIVPKADIVCNVTAAKWATLCLPFSATVPEGMKAYTVSGHEGSELLLTEVADGKLQKDVPYLVNAPEGTYPFSGPAAANPANYKNGMLVGSTSTDFTAPKGAYILANYKGELGFYRIGADKQCRQYTAYLAAPAGVTLTAFKIVDSPSTGITTVEGNKSAGTPQIYDLTGRRLRTADAKGVVIIDGKKVIK